MTKYVKKGNKIGVIGELQKDEYIAKDGTKRYVVRVLVSEVEFLGGGENKSEKPPQQNEYESIDDDDLPF